MAAGGGGQLVLGRQPALDVLPAEPAHRLVADGLGEVAQGRTGVADGERRELVAGQALGEVGLDQVGDGRRLLRRHGRESPRSARRAASRRSAWGAAR